MNGIAFGFPWRYRPMTDELIVMTSSQVYKLRVYENLGRPGRDQVKKLADELVLRDLLDLKRTAGEQIH